VRVRCGLDVLLDDPAALRGRRIGLVANAASVTSGLVPALRALLDADVDVRTLFAPEHGFWGAAQDLEPVRGERAGVPVVSLYGERFEDLAPRPEHLQGLDAVVCDLPDVGSRYYTFVWTTALVMKACAARGVPVFVLDRPNPLGGEAMEGNVPEPALLSFVGLHPVPVRHGMTPGELARHVNESASLGCDLTVIALEGGGRRAARAALAGEDGPWVLPSPNMPARETAFVYPGACLVEGTNLSEGRGTTRPFELVGAPWLDAEAAADAANALELPGVVFRPHAFRPTFQKHAGALCGGVQIHVVDRARFRPFETGLRLVKALRDLDPTSFRWRTERYEYREDVPAIDLLAGTQTFRELVDAGSPLDEWIASFADDLARFAPLRERALLYRERPRAFQLVGAHESGKTTLMVKLLEALASKGWRVGSVKETHHEYDTDVPGKDSQRHGAAGANPAVLVAGRRVAVHRRGDDAPTLASLLGDELAFCDVVLVEGFRRERLPKLEVVRAATGRTPVALGDPTVVAVAADAATSHAPELPRFALDDVSGILAFVETALGLSKGNA
jgi:molybdopterin-guanine dinucleotide biosynthesis protein MobB